MGRLRLAIVGLLGLLGLLALSGFLFLPGWLGKKIETAVSESCKECRLLIGGTAVGVFPLRVFLRKLDFRQGDPRDSAVFAQASEVVVPLRSFSSPWKIGLVQVNDLHVTVHEGDSHFPRDPPAEEEGGAAFECEGIEIRRSAFTYRKDSAGGAAYIRFPAVDGEVGAFGSSSPWREREIKAKVIARMEQSGQVNLQVSAKLHEGEPWVDVDLRLQKLPLAEVNSFFEPEEGISLKGALIDARGRVKVRDRRAEGWTAVRYEELGVKFHQNRKRAGLAAFFTNLAVKLKLSEGNSTEPSSEREESVVVSRHGRESVVSFILRALREAAFRVAGA